MKRLIRKNWIVLATLAIVLLFVSWIGIGVAERYFLSRTALSNQSTLKLAVAGLRGALRRYQPLPELIADKVAIRQMLLQPANSEMKTSINQQLKRIAKSVVASDVYLLDHTGLTIAASNFELSTSFIGRDYSFRPYFQSAINGALGRYFAFGIASLKRGYYFSSPVVEDGKNIGVVVVKINIDRFEEAWRGNQSEIAVIDKNGIIFMSSRQDWHFKSLGSIDTSALENIRKSRQYPIERILALDMAAPVNGPLETQIVKFTAKNAQEYIVQSTSMPEAEWTVKLFSSTATATRQAYGALATALLVVLLSVLTLALVLQRRAQLFERIRAQNETHELLEKRVDERTVDLNTANTKLTAEIHERIDTENRLRKTQTELIQAGKLAALGQMSAALSHELNQPLAAVKSYADNAVVYLERERVEEARENIESISGLADRMATISKHLRNFARKPREKMTPVPIATTVNDAIEIMASEVKMNNASITVDFPKNELWAHAGQIRLQQVLVNLIRNGLDAMAETTTAPLIEISAHEKPDRVEIQVRDHGSGLAKGVIDEIFDPFFTTKGVSKGLGLGLSISYNIIRDFDGSISARNHDDGGAIFTIDLALADQRKEIAAQ